MSNKSMHPHLFAVAWRYFRDQRENWNVKQLSCEWNGRLTRQRHDSVDEWWTFSLILIIHLSGKGVLYFVRLALSRRVHKSSSICIDIFHDVWKFSFRLALARVKKLSTFQLVRFVSAPQPSRPFKIPSSIADEHNNSKTWSQDIRIMTWKFVFVADLSPNLSLCPIRAFHTSLSFSIVSVSGSLELLCFFPRPSREFFGVFALAVSVCSSEREELRSCENDDEWRNNENEKSVAASTRNKITQNYHTIEHNKKTIFISALLFFIAWMAVKIEEFSKSNFSSVSENILNIDARARCRWSEKKRREIFHAQKKREKSLTINLIVRRLNDLSSN